MADIYPLSTVHQVLAQIQKANAELQESLDASPVEEARVAAALALGASVDAMGRGPRGERRTTVLHQAIRKQNPGLAAMLLAHGASPHEPDFDQRTPLMEAAHNNAAWAVSLLVAAGADHTLSQVNRGGTALEQALAAEADDAVEALCVLPGVDLRSGTLRFFQQEPLLGQARTVRAVRALIAADTTHPWPTSEQHDLISGLVHRSGDRNATLGAQKGSTVIGALIEAGFSPPNDALYWAAQQGNAPLLELLDALGMNWHTVPEGLSTTVGQVSPLEFLRKRPDTSLWVHWHAILTARAQAAALGTAIGDAQTPPARPRM